MYQANQNNRMYPATGQINSNNYNANLNPNLNLNPNFHPNFNPNFNPNLNNNLNHHNSNIYYNNNNLYHHNNNSIENNSVNRKENFTIDKIREFPLKQIIIEREYDVLREIGSGGKLIENNLKKSKKDLILILYKFIFLI